MARVVIFPIPSMLMVKRDCLVRDAKQQLGENLGQTEGATFAPNVSCQVVQDNLARGRSLIEDSRYWDGRLYPLGEVAGPIQ